MYKGLMDGCLNFFSVTAYECESWEINDSVKRKIKALLHDAARKSCISPGQVEDENFSSIMFCNANLSCCLN